MKKFYSLALVSVNCLAIAFSSLAHALNRPSTATAYVGAGWDHLDSKRHIDNAGMPLLALGYNFTYNWGVEALLGKFNTDSHHSVNDGRSVNGTLFAFDAVYHFCASCNIQPYALAGFSAIGLNPNGTDAHDEGGINGGLGLQIFATPNVALRLEARDFYTFTGGKNDVFLNAGVSFLFDVCGLNICHGRG